MIRPALPWVAQADYSDIRYETCDGIAKITINRPERRNAFRPETVMQLIDAFHLAHRDNAVGAIILTGDGGWRLLTPEEFRRRQDAETPAPEVVTA